MVVIQLQLSDQIVAVDTVIGAWVTVTVTVTVLVGQVVAEELLVGGIELATRWERKRRRSGVLRVSHEWMGGRFIGLNRGAESERGGGGVFVGHKEACP